VVLLIRDWLPLVVRRSSAIVSEGVVVAENAAEINVKVFRIE
jgi:hypothetical protein